MNQLSKLHEAFNHPAIIKVCTCEQCRYIKNKRKNRKYKKKIKRLLNKKRRHSKKSIITHFWA